MPARAAPADPTRDRSSLDLPQHPSFIAGVADALLRANLAATTVINLVLARSLARPSSATFFLAWPASELSPALLWLQSWNLLVAHLLCPGVFTRDWFGRFVALANAFSIGVFARAAFFNMFSRFEFSAALKNQLGIDMQANVWKGLFLDMLCIVPLGSVARRGRRMRASRDVAYADWQVVDPKQLQAWQRLPKGLKRLNAMVGRGVGAKWLSLDIVTLDEPVPSASQKLRDVLVYIHGGAWGIGDKQFAAHAILNRLASRGFLCVSINYRLVPDCAFPAAIEDCKRALHWIKLHVAELGGNPARIFAAGESAGGHLSALLATCGRDYHPAEIPLDADFKLAGAIPLYGVFDWSDTKGLQSAIHPALLEGMDGGMRPFIERVVLQKSFEKHKDEFDQASPAHRLTTMKEPACPFFIVHGTDDQLAAHIGSVDFFERLKEHRSSRKTSPIKDVFISLSDAHHQFGYLPSPRAMALADAMARWMQFV